MIRSNPSVAKRSLTALIALGGLIAFIYLISEVLIIEPYLYRKKTAPVPIPLNASYTKQSISSQELLDMVDAAKHGTADTTNWPTLRNIKYGYQFIYPPGTVLKGYTEASEMTDPQYANRLTLLAYSDVGSPVSNPDSHLLMDIEHVSLIETTINCSNNPIAHLPVFVYELRDVANKAKKEIFKNHYRSVGMIEVELFDNLKAYTIKLTGFSLFRGCLSPLSASPPTSEIYRFFEDGDSRLDVRTIGSDDNPENPLNLVILDTLKFD